MTHRRAKYAMWCLLACSLAGSLAGCKPDPAVEKAAVVDGGTKKPAPPTGSEATANDNRSPVAGTSPAPAASGSITGTILFAGKVPPAAVIDTSMDPACSMSSSGTLHAEQYVVNNGKLANVFVYIKSAPGSVMQASPSAVPVVLDQAGCRYVPHVIGVAAGGNVEFRNSDPTMHNIHTMPTGVGNETIDISQGPKGAPVTKRFLRPELMIPVRCNNHPWMNAFINVAPSPYFAVSGPAGRFEIRGLPAGDYVIGAVHEKLGEQTMQVHVAGGASKSDFTFTPK